MLNTLSVAEFRKQFKHDKDILYGYTKYIKDINCKFFSGATLDSIPKKIKPFWDRSTHPLTKAYSNLDLGNQNTRGCKGELIETAINGGIIHFIINDTLVPSGTRITNDGAIIPSEKSLSPSDQIVKTYNSLKITVEKPNGCNKMATIKQITRSELAFLCRYWDLYFYNKVKFYYYDDNQKTLTLVNAPWKDSRNTEWVQYYQAQPSDKDEKERKEERKQTFKELFLPKLEKETASIKEITQMMQSFRVCCK